MHSSGRGEETPEPYSGAVQPTGQQQAYGGHAQPAPGTPWGDPAAAPGMPPQLPQQPVEAADATQMLPPYPAAGPAAAPPPIPAAPPQAPAQPPAPFPGQVPQPPAPGLFPGQAPQPPVQPVPPAEATQMLPPYPAGGPGEPAPPAEATQMLPPYPAGGPGEPAPAEATQPLAVFREQQGYDEYGSPAAAPQQFPDQAQYPGQALYPDQQSYGGQQQYTDPAAFEQPVQPDSDYDHLFRSDVPGPEPMRPRILQPHDSRSQQGGHPGRQWQQGQGDGGHQGYDGYADDGEDDGGRRISPKVLIGIVVAGCVVAGLVVGGMMSGGGGKANADADRPSATAASTPSGTAGGDGKKAGAGADTAEAQAQALDALLASSGASRSSVVSAVESIRGCKNLPGSAADLRAAATQRDGLVTRLGALSVDKLPKHDELTTALTKAWKASASADSHYAAWADQAAGNADVCKGGHARNTGESQAGAKESGTATTQKKAAVKLWNSIADTYGLTKRQYSQL
ncbi:hypothetical protein [Streptomyces sp. NRRL F-5123]|uniref:hypothetical protein n=1 Tax=Streptomyces sp. NRRL F-5123 TaxID=1463856 RepID=UPI00069454C0|nr:hypothetical protein [Streptomyces sp. NRRL F-5123]